MGVSFGRARVADLTFMVYGRCLHPDWFMSRGHRRYAKGGWEADVRIIEGGHVVNWKFGGIRLTEVLAGAETTLPEPGLLFHSAVRHDRATSLQPTSNCEYQTCFEVERVQPEVFSHLTQELLVERGRDLLFHEFSQPNRLTCAALSVVRLETSPNGFLIHAFHTFPEERAIVRTHSLFETARATVR